MNKIYHGLFTRRIYCMPHSINYMRLYFTTDICQCVFCHLHRNKRSNIVRCSMR